MMLDLAAYFITAKVFTEFVVLIIRNRIYMLLTDGRYRLDYAYNSNPENDTEIMLF